MGGDKTMPRWLIAVAVGAPITVALAYYYIRKKDVDRYTDKDKNGTIKGITKSVADQEQLSTSPRVDAVPQTALERVLSLKNSGNEMFKKKKFSDAIKCYTEAISLCPSAKTDQLSVLYQNRAACYEAMNDVEAVMKDINVSLELNPTYVKALMRRCNAAEKLEQYRLCVEDLTTLCLIEKFSNVNTLAKVDNMLKKVGAIEGKKAVARRVPSDPSSHFVKCFFASFSQDPVINSLPKDAPSPQSQPGDAPLFGLEAAKVALLENRYDDVIAKCTEQIETDESSNRTNENTYCQALLLRGSLLILKTDYSKAFEDLNRIVELEPDDVKVTVNALIKRATLHLQVEDEDKCLWDFNKAASLDPTNPDIYYHRGQLMMLINKMDESLHDFNTAHKYNPDFVLLSAQRLYTVYRHSVQKGNESEANKAVQDLKELANEKKCIGGEASLLLAQIYLDMQDFESAEKAFDKALNEDQENATILVHKGLLELQWHQDIDKAVDYMEKAIAVDPLLSFAYETLANVEVQRGKLDRAISLFDKALTLSKGERETVHICSLKAAAETQLKMAERLIHS